MRVPRTSTAVWCWGPRIRRVPLALIDLIGLDTLKLVAECLYAEFREPHYAPPALLARMVEAGILGRKSGRGFFAYGG
jgi:3-hydroxybutyryl-CoA dehydrogenase